MCFPWFRIEVVELEAVERMRLTLQFVLPHHRLPTSCRRVGKRKITSSNPYKSGKNVGQNGSVGACAVLLWQLTNNEEVQSNKKWHGDLRLRKLCSYSTKKDSMVKAEL